MSDDIPPLQDFQSELKQIQSKSSPPAAEDYLKMNTRHVQDQQKQAQLLKKAQQEVRTIQSKLKPKEFGGLKKGFFSSQPAAKQQMPEIKHKKSQPLRIPQVQEAMKLNNYLEQTKKEWMTQGFLNNVEQNNKIQRLFSNPEYVKAIEMFKNNPKEAMIKYGSNKEFMEGFQEFCMLMGNQFKNIKK